MATAPDQPASDLADRLTALGENVASVYLPTPDIQVGGEKFRIAVKNAIQQLAGRGGAAETVIARLEALELDEMQSPARAFFSDGETLLEAKMNQAPRALAATDTSALWLPLLADSADEASAWVVVVDRAAPKLYNASPSRMVDYSGVVDLPDFEAIQARRVPQVDVLFHSTSSGRRTPNHGGFAKFHALGTSQEEEQEKTEEVFFRELAMAIAHGVPASARTIILVGDPRAAGHTRAHLEGEPHELVYLEDAGDGSDPDRLASAITGFLSARASKEAARTLDETRPEALIEASDLAEAGRMGRVDTVWIARPASGLRASPEDEWLSFDDPEEVAAICRHQALIRPALDTGARLCPCGPDLLGKDRTLLATARY